MSDSAQTILLVDDEPNILVAIEFLLEQQGYQISKAFDGQEALQFLEQQTPHLIVLDVMMPEMDGFTVATKIREQPQLAQIPIIFLTAKGTKEDRWKGYQSGGEVYLTKPFDNDELVNLVNECLQYG